ncbi:cytochrome P450 [Mycena crocata]|nr:cytochrome P450 [Mycena crocata]
MHAKSVLLAGFASSMKACRRYEIMEPILISPWKNSRLFSTTDPSYDTSALPYLEAVVSEALRLHPIIDVDDAPRLALEGDVLPLRTPIRTASGALIGRVPIRKGTVLTVPVPLQYTNVAISSWGADAAKFKPERWLRDVPASAKDYPGYHHTMSFLDGPRTCLGGFAIIEMKIVLSLLTRKFVFLPRDGKGTKFDPAFFSRFTPEGRW